MAAEPELPRTLEQQATAGQLVADCIDDRHPTLVGRICIRVVLPEGSTVERWVPTLRGLAVRVGDRVLVTKPINWAEAVVIGMLDGFARRVRPVDVRGELTLAAGEVVRVCDARGAALAEIAE